MASAVTAFRMPVFLLSTGTWGPLRAADRCHSATWFRYKNSRTIQRRERIDKFKILELLIRSYLV
jgi:hypothetical protein